MFHKPKSPKHDMKENNESKSAPTSSPETPATQQQGATPESAPTDPKTKELLGQIEQLKAEKQELNDKYLRLGADYANFQKRVPKQVADSVAYEKKTFLRSLLGSLDNFAHALNGADAAVKSPAAMQGWISGIRMVHQHLLDALKTQGVERIVSVGQPFDPSMHEALTSRAEADKPDGIVLEEYQGGYSFQGQVLRPCKVIINKLPADSSAEETRDDTDGADAAGK
jgi:molecular chaperone GrpE